MHSTYFISGVGDYNPRARGLTTTPKIMHQLVHDQLLPKELGPKSCLLKIPSKAREVPYPKAHAEEVLHRTKFRLLAMGFRACLQRLLMGHVVPASMQEGAL